MRLFVIACGTWHRRTCRTPAIWPLSGRCGSFAYGGKAAAVHRGNAQLLQPRRSASPRTRRSHRGPPRREGAVVRGELTSASRPHGARGRPGFKELAEKCKQLSAEEKASLSALGRAATAASRRGTQAGMTSFGVSRRTVLRAAARGARENMARRGLRARLGHDGVSVSVADTLALT